jgi:hypothetical protein
MMRLRWARHALPLLMLLLAAPVLAQTATPTPSPQPTSGAAATLAALPVYGEGTVLPTLTPMATVAWPTLTPNALVPVPWAGVGLQEMTPGGAYDPPPFPELNEPDLPGIETANGFMGINDANIAGFMVYMIDVGLGFYQWFSVNFPRVVVGARWFVIIMIVLYGMFLLWKGSKFAPPDAERDANPGRFFLRTFRLQDRYYANTRERRERKSKTP